MVHIKVADINELNNVCILNIFCAISLFFFVLEVSMFPLMCMCFFYGAYRSCIVRQV
jgi:hypothetical protein